MSNRLGSVVVSQIFRDDIDSSQPLKFQCGASLRALPDEKRWSIPHQHQMFGCLNCGINPQNQVEQWPKPWFFAVYRGVHYPIFVGIAIRYYRCLWTNQYNAMSHGFWTLLSWDSAILVYFDQSRCIWSCRFWVLFLKRKRPAPLVKVSWRRGCKSCHRRNWERNRNRHKNCKDQKGRSEEQWKRNLKPSDKIMLQYLVICLKLLECWELFLCWDQWHQNVWREKGSDSTAWRGRSQCLCRWVDVIRSVISDGTLWCPWSLMNSSLFGTGCSGKILRSLCVKIEEEFATLRQDLEGFQMERD